jgi:hypothetical protein
MLGAGAALGAAACDWCQRTRAIRTPWLIGGRGGSGGSSADRFETSVLRVGNSILTVQQMVVYLSSSWHAQRS